MYNNKQRKGLPKEMEFLTNLEHLDLTATGLGFFDVANFRKYNPKCHIEFNRFIF